jgi:hypothetical protein
MRISGDHHNGLKEVSIMYHEEKKLGVVPVRRKDGETTHAFNRNLPKEPGATRILSLIQGLVKQAKEERGTALVLQ